MDRTIIAVHRMLDALAAATYDVGILSDRGMFPGHASLTKEAVLAKTKFLKSQNARGAHIYIRPSGIHNLTVLDDLAQESVDRLSADGFEPCAVVETSPGNFQAWLKHHRTYETAVSTFIAQELARRYQADPSAADWRRFGRLPGFTNCKPKHRQANGLFPFVLLRSCSGKPFTRAEAFGLETDEPLSAPAGTEQARDRTPRRAAEALSPYWGEVLEALSRAVPCAAQIPRSSCRSRYGLLHLGSFSRYARRRHHARAGRRLSVP